MGELFPSAAYPGSLLTRCVLQRVKRYLNRRECLVCHSEKCGPQPCLADGMRESIVFDPLANHGEGLRGDALERIIKFLKDEA